MEPKACTGLWDTHWNQTPFPLTPQPSCILFLPHRTDSEMLVFQHADFKKLSPRVEETEGPKTEGSLVPKQSKKSKKRKSTLDITVVPAASTAGTLLPEPTGVESECKEMGSYKLGFFSIRFLVGEERDWMHLRY